MYFQVNNLERVGLCVVCIVVDSPAVPILSNDLAYSIPGDEKSRMEEIAARLIY